MGSPTPIPIPTPIVLDSKMWPGLYIGGLWTRESMSHWGEESVSVWRAPSGLATIEAVVQAHDRARDAAVATARHAVEAGHHCLYVSLELDRAAIAARVVALGQTKHHWSALWRREVEREEVARLIEGDAVMRSRRFRVELAPPMGWDPATLHDRVRALRRLSDLTPLVVVDTLTADELDVHDDYLRAIALGEYAVIYVVCRDIPLRGIPLEG